MRKNIFFSMVTAVSLFMSCSGDGTKNVPKSNLDEDSLVTTLLDGDSTLYGLACDGCNDSVVVFLPESGGDPITYDVLEASRKHKIFGRPRIGDRVALVMNQNLPNVCDMLINIERLRGTWCYMVEPTINRMVGVSEQRQQEMLRNMPDSIRQKYMQPREYGITFKSEWLASAVYDRSILNNRSSMVSYPEPRYYTGWHILNGKLVLTRTKDINLIDKKNNEIINDTIDLIALRRDTLIMRIDGKDIGFYRRDKAK